MKTFKVYLASYGGSKPEGKEAERIISDCISHLEWPVDIEMPAPRLSEKMVPNSLLFYNTSAYGSSWGMLRKLAPASPTTTCRVIVPSLAAPSGLVAEAPHAADIVSAANNLEAPCLMMGIDMIYSVNQFTKTEIKNLLGISLESILHAYYVGGAYHKTPVDWETGSSSEFRGAFNKVGVAHAEGRWGGEPREVKLLTSISFNVKERRAA